MSTQPTLFDAVRSEARKRRGMDIAAAHKNDLLEQARRGLYLIAVKREDRCCTADDAAAWLDAHELPQLGNAAGQLFKNGEWTWTGKFTYSRRVNAHRNLLRVWQLRGAA